MPSGLLRATLGVPNLSSARRLSPDWGHPGPHFYYYGGVLAHSLPPGAACGEQDPESRPTVSPALLAIAFHRSDPDLAANFGGKLVGLCVRTLWAPSPPRVNKQTEDARSHVFPPPTPADSLFRPEGIPLAQSSPRRNSKKETLVGAQKCQGPKVRWS